VKYAEVDESHGNKKVQDELVMDLHDLLFGAVEVLLMDLAMTRAMNRRSTKRCA
jgi:hypothetical protein